MTFLKNIRSIAVALASSRRRVFFQSSALSLSAVAVALSWSLCTTARAIDTTPIVGLSSPRQHQEFNDPSTIYLAGYAVDRGAGVAGLTVLLNGLTNNSFWDGSSPWGPVNLSDIAFPFSALLPGTNTLYLWATGYDGTNSKAIRREFFYQVPSSVTLNVTGNGFAAGPLTGGGAFTGFRYIDLATGKLQANTTSVPIYVGRSYRFVAMPQAGNLFDYWSDSSGKILSSNAVLNFLLPGPNVSLTAHFVPDLFAQMRGTYRALVAGSAEHTIGDGFDETYAYNGIVTLTTTPRGAYSGKLVFGLVSYSFSGKFSQSGGNATSILTIRPDTNTVVQINLNISPSGETFVLSGGATVNRSVTVAGNGDNFSAGGSFTGELFKPLRSPQAGHYNVAIGPVIGENEANSLAGPGGYSYGRADVTAGGSVVLSMHMADNNAGTITFSSALDKNGNFPFYAPIYATTGLTNKHGSVTGTVNSSSQNVIFGTIAWTKPPVPTWSYPEGFNATVTYHATRYTPPRAGENIFDWTSGTLRLDADYIVRTLYGPSTNQFTVLEEINSGGGILHPAAGSIKMSLTTSSGYINGSLTNNGVKVTFNGCVLPKSFHSPISFDVPTAFFDSPAPAAFGYLIYSNRSYSAYVGQ